jgi:hypothetical protein
MCHHYTCSCCRQSSYHHSSSPLLPPSHASHPTCCWLVSLVVADDKTIGRLTMFVWNLCRGRRVRKMTALESKAKLCACVHVCERACMCAQVMVWNCGKRVSMYKEGKGKGPTSSSKWKDCMGRDVTANQGALQSVRCGTGS